MIIKSSYFKGFLKDNLVKIFKADNKNYMTVHSAEDNYGILRKIVLDQEVEEELSFNIKGKDAALLSKFEEFDISIKQNSIKFKSKNLKLSFQNYELVMHPPKMTDAIDINFDIEIFKKLSKWSTGEKGSVVVFSNKIIGTDSIIMNTVETDTGIKSPISIPINVLKCLENKTYKVKAHRNNVFFLAKGEVIYSTLLIDVPLGLQNLKVETDGKLTLDRFEFIKLLDGAKYFSERVRLEIKKDKVKIVTLEEDETKSYQAELDCESNFDSNLCFDISYLIKLLQESNNDEINFAIKRFMAIIYHERGFALACGVKEN